MQRKKKAILEIKNTSKLDDCQQVDVIMLVVSKVDEKLWIASDFVSRSWGWHVKEIAKLEGGCSQVDSRQAIWKQDGWCD